MPMPRNSRLEHTEHLLSVENEGQLATHVQLMDGWVEVRQLSDFALINILRFTLPVRHQCILSVN